MKTLRDAVLIAIIAAIAALAVNSARNLAGLNGLPMDKPWPDNRKKVQLEYPPSYEEGDSLVSLEDAYYLYLSGNAIFIDAREQEEYDEAHIAGAINLPFEFWDEYWDDVEPRLNPAREIVAYCGGLDCELSLFLARELKWLGYEKSYIFFGGWLKWSEEGLPISEPEND